MHFVIQIITLKFLSIKKECSQLKNSTKSLDDIDVNLLFNKFYTVDKSRTKGSSGLGLYIVKELLKKIDGKIENVSYEKNILSISICFPLYNDKKLL